MYVPNALASLNKDYLARFFTSDATPEGKLIWTLLCEVADMLEEEVKTEPARSFTLSPEERQKGFYPLYFNFSDAVKHFRDFQRVLELYGQVSGHLPQPQLYRETIYNALYDGKTAIQSINKTFFIISTYYKRYGNQSTIQPAEDFNRSILLLYQYFEPNTLSLSELFPSDYPRIGLSDLLDNVWQWMEEVNPRPRFGRQYIDSGKFNLSK